MSELKDIRFEEQSDKIKDRVQGYWSKRADSFFELRHEELESNKAARWRMEIQKHIPAGKTVKVLDIGCGSGFFEIILGKEGHTITGIDLTKEMVDGANAMIAAYGLDSKQVKAVQMDAEKLSFEDETFDLIITRNVTWTLPHPIEAYSEWRRVLKKGGLILNFDAEYAKNAHTNLYSPDNLAHQGVSNELKDECHDIYHMLAISSLARPEWDVAILEELGFTKVETDIEFGDRIYKERDRFYMLDRMFCIAAMK